MRNRLKAPTKHILVLDDVINNQARLAQHFNEIFEHEGDIEVSFVSGGNYGIAIVKYSPPDLIILDHDMPSGDGGEFLKWLRDLGEKIPVITFSGIQSNNQHLLDLGADYGFEKEAVIQGLADEVIFEILNANRK